MTFCTITIGGRASRTDQSRIAFYIRHYRQLNDEFRFLTLKQDDFWLVNPNTGNCPIFRTQADAELTKAIYRRVPVLWRQGTEAEPEINPWRLSFMRMFDMANDSHHFRTAPELEKEGYRLKGSIYVGPKDSCLPLYDAKMLHQFDHRFSTYEGVTEKQLNVGILPQPTAEQKRDPNFVVQPRYWVREEVVNSVIPRHPDIVAKSLDTRQRSCVQFALALWIAGHYLNRNDKKAADRWLNAATRINAPETISGMLFNATAPIKFCRQCGHDY